MLNNLAPHSRVWVFQANRFLTETDISLIQKNMKEFIPNWAAHGNDLYGDFQVAENLFLIVGVDESKSPTSGCSVDALTRVIKKTGEEISVDFFDRLRVAYLDEQQKIQIVPLNEFKSLLKSDTVRQSTTVFNNLIETKADLETKWKTPVKNSWHKNLIQIL